MADKPLTRRGLLSTLSSTYDPLVLGGSFLLKGRQIILQLCRNGLNLDEPIAERSSYEWQKWKNNFSMVESGSATFKTHGNSLNDEGLRTPVAETEAIINSIKN